MDSVQPDSLAVYIQLDHRAKVGDQDDLSEACTSIQVEQPYELLPDDLTAIHSS